ncbi:MAG: flagellar motor switch protein FliN [Gammaproteobacteria bacterium]
MTDSDKPDTPEEQDSPATEPTGDAAPPDAGASGEFEAADFQQVNGNGQGDGPRPDVDLILDVPVTLALEVGRTEMTIGKLLNLSQGAVVELDRNAGEPLDVIVNGALIARGEIVVVNDKFGIRLIDIVASNDNALVEAQEQHG